MIAVTLPPLYRKELVELIASHPLVDILRYNTGMDSNKSPAEITEQLDQLAKEFNKKIWLDLKGRQLRVVSWAAPNYGTIELNHELEVDGSARVHFRGSGWTDLKFVSGRMIYVDPPPPQAIGRGQSVNIVGEHVRIINNNNGCLTPLDKEYIQAATSANFQALLLSFVEELDDVSQIIALTRNRNFSPFIGLKIESAKGLAFAQDYFDTDDHQYFNVFPILARDDLANELGSGVAVTKAAETMIKLCYKSVAASRFFSELLLTGEAGPADFSDWHWLHQLGYQDFLLQDELCLNPDSFEKVMQVMEDYNRSYPKPGEQPWLSRSLSSPVCYLETKAKVQ